MPRPQSITDINIQAGEDPIVVRETAFSHSLIIWLLAAVALHFGSRFNAESTEPYFQLASGIIIIALAVWMFCRTRREQVAASTHSHDHSLDGPHGGQLVDTGKGFIEKAPWLSSSVKEVMYGAYPHTPYRQSETCFFHCSGSKCPPVSKKHAILHHHPESETMALRARLHKIVGQLNGVEGMLEAERDCGEVLTQLVSARKALKSLSEKIIHSHLHHCIEGAMNNADAKRSLHALLSVLERYVE